jgi:Ca-activated chloride channel homolog
MVASVPHHRRSGRVWTAAVTACALALALGGGTAGYLRLTGSESCAEPAVRLTVAASVDQFAILNRLAETFTAGGRTVAARCAEVSVRPAVPHAVAAQLGPAWDEQRDGPRPDVWAPDSSAWLLVAAARPEAKALLPTGAPPSLATSPVTLAMQRPMAQAMGWPDRDIGLTDLLGPGDVGPGDPLGTGQHWARFGHPEWGPLRLGMSDPNRSTAGLVTVLTILDADNDGTLGNDELVGGLRFAQLVSATAEDADGLLRPYVDADPNRAPGNLPAAVPVLERDLAAHFGQRPTVDLVPVYLKEGSTFADYPYTVLRAPWVDADRQRLAADFLDFLRSGAAQKAYAEAGFRDPSRSTQDTSLLDPARGFKLEVNGPQRAPTEAGLAQLTSMWTTLQRPNNALLVLDTSASMGEPVPGTSLTRLQLVQRAAIQGAAVLNNQTTVGLWQFSLRLTPAADYRELVAPGKAGDRVGGVVRRQAVVSAVQGLRADGGTGLYDTVYAAYLRMRQAWRPNAQNVLVVMTDGRNDDDGLSLSDLLGRLRAANRTDQPLPVIGIAVGPQADASALQEISRATGGRTIVARDDVSAIQQIVLAFAGRLEAR